VKIGDLVRHRDRPGYTRTSTGIVVRVSKHNGITLIDVHWSLFGGDTPRTVYGYMPNELRPFDESR